MHRHLRLQHHKHTGKLLEHRHTSFWAIALILLLTGACIMSFRQMAYADNLTVTASVEAAAPNKAARITSPETGITVSDSLIQVSGTCQQVVPLTIISIYRNDTLAGSTACSPSNTFVVQILLTEGANSLVAKSSSITGLYGPDSSAVTVALRSSVFGASKFTMQSRSAYVIFGPNLKATWRGFFLNGQPPYKIEIDWGDNTKDKIMVRDSSEQVFSHRYTKMTSHIIAITAADATGASIRQEFAAVTPYTAILGTEPQANNPPFMTRLDSYVYVAYFLTLGLAGLAWHDMQRKKLVPAKRRAVYHQARRHSRRG